MTDANKEGIFGYYSATGDDAIISADPVSRITDQDYNTSVKLVNRNDGLIVYVVTKTRTLYLDIRREGVIGMYWNRGYKSSRSVPIFT